MLSVSYPCGISGMNKYKSKREKRIRRHKRVRAKILGTAERPRLSVFRSNKHLYAQLIDDVSGKTLVSSSSMEFKKNKKIKSAKKTENIDDGGRVEKIGTVLAEKALAKGIKEAVFDRGGYAYHGNIKKLADAARKGGLRF